MKRTVNLIVVSLLLLAVLPVGVTAQTAQLYDGDARYFDDPPDSSGSSSPSSPTSPSTGSFTFYAIYDRIVGSESLAEPGINHLVMSGDGEKLVLSSYHYVYTVNADGSNLATFPEPHDSWGIHTLTIDQDGSRAFFVAGVKGTNTLDHLYKVENGLVTDILNVGDYTDIASIDQIQTTANGEYVYFLDDGVNDNDVWRVAHTGGTPTKVIEDTAVIHSGHPGEQVAEFAISADAGAIAFTLYGYRDPGYHGQKELFVKDGGGYTQLTSGGATYARTVGAISGDGATIVYRDSDDNTRYAIRPDGSNRIALEYVSYNNAGEVLTYDGTQMFYNDNASHGGRLTNTDGSGRIDLFPKPLIYLGVTGNPSISNDGRRVAFKYKEGDYQYAVYVGYLNDPGAVPDAPTIHNIAFDPAAMPRGDPSARVTLTSQISDPQGLADIERTSTDELMEGVHKGYWEDIPVSIPTSAHDDGTAPDETAGDGVFSTSGQPVTGIDDFDQMTVRMGAQDASKTVVIADTTLLIGSPGQMPLLPPTNLQAQPGMESIELTWNPSTSPDLAGYNVYRSTVYTDTSDSAYWAQINPGLVTGDRYLDSSSLTAGATYYYYLTATDAVSESIPSNVASAVFGQVKLFIPDSYGTSGMTVTLPVNIANADGIEMCAVDIYVTYDQNVLTATDVYSTALTAGYAWAKNTSTPGVVRAVIATTLGETLYGEGTLFNVLFDVAGSSGDTSDLEFQVTGTFFYDCGDLVNPVPLDLTDVGVFTVQSGYILGDLNGDGVVSLADATLALEIAVGNVIPTPEQEAAGDLNGDGRINSADAVLIMRLAAGLPLFPTAAQLNALSLARADAVSISAPTDATLPKGSSVWVALSIDDAANLAGADITLNYDPFIATATGARTTTLSANFDVELNVPVAGQAKISLKPKPGHEDGLTSGSGALVEVQFTATDDATVDDTSSLTLATARLGDRYGRDFATSALQVDVNTANGVLTVEESSYSIYLPLVLR